MALKNFSFWLRAKTQFGKKSNNKLMWGENFQSKIFKEIIQAFSYLLMQNGKIKFSYT